MTAKKSVSALLDRSYKSPGTSDIVFRIDDVEIPIAASATECTHRDTICQQCARVWQIGLLITEALPWER